MIGRIKKGNEIAGRCSRHAHRYWHLSLCLLVGVFIFCFVCLGRAEEGLVLYYTFDEGSGSIAHDKSGSKNDGKIYGAEYVKGYGLKGYALKFDGVDDYVDCGNNESLNMGTSDFSIEFWCNIDELPDGFWGVISKKGGEWVGASAGYEVIVGSGVWVYLGDGVTNPGYLCRTRHLENTGWHHVVFTLDRDGNGKSYVDGTLERTSDISTAQGSLDNTLNLNIMRRSDYSQYSVKGIIDEVRIYKRVLSEEEIKEPFKKKFAEKISSLKQTLAEREEELIGILPPPEKEMKKETEAIISSLKEKLDKAEKRRTIYPFEEEEINKSMEELNRIISVIKKKES